MVDRQESPAGSPERERCLAMLAREILLVERPHPVRVAIDGPDCAGKTMLADELAPLLERSGRPTIRASVDCFHRPRAERYAMGELSPMGYYWDSFDYERLDGELLQPLGPAGDRQIRRRAFDFRTDEPIDCEWESAPANSILLFDGVFLLRKELVDHWDFSIFVTVPFQETLRRALDRDFELLGSRERVRERYERRYIPGQQLYYVRAHPEHRADVVVDNADPAAPQLIWR